MALDTYEALAGKVHLRCPAASILLCRDWVSLAFRQIAERRRWSWLIKNGQFIAPASVTAGTVTVTNNSSTVTGSGTAWDSSLVGRQFRTGVTTPIYNIVNVPSTTSLDLDAVWGAATASAQNYEIYQAYFTPPSDFHAFVALWDPANNWRLWLNIHQEELNAWDAQRSNATNPYCVSARDYTSDRVGTVSAPIQALGSGPDPVSTTETGYKGVSDAVFTVEITTGGASGTAVFRWRKDEGTYTTGVVTDSNAQELRDGVFVYWPTATYVLGDIWVIRATALTSPGLPRYELWPHQKALKVFPFTYEARATDLEDQGAVLPRYIRGDVLLEMALANCARWPGPSADKPNPYSNPIVAGMHDRRAEAMIAELERQDDETMEQDIGYQRWSALPYAVFPFGADWMQKHDVYV